MRRSTLALLSAALGTKGGFRISTVCFVCLTACSSTLPRPATTPQPRGAFDVVPYPPPSALVEIIPESPGDNAVWIDGYWAWRGRYYVWERGGWVTEPDGARVALWEARYRDDGVLLYAPTTWRRDDGTLVDAPPLLRPAAAPPAQQTAEPTTIP
jgi:hypothetical protein